MAELGLPDLLDMAIVQKMADAHYRAAGVPIGIVSALDDAILVGSGWQDICVKFHRANQRSLERCRESDKFIKNRLVRGEACHYKCKNGLWDIGIPIVVAGRHLATLFLGQFFYEQEVPDREFFMRQAREFGFDVDDYLAALDRVPVFSRNQVDTILEYDKALVAFIADLAEHALFRAEAEEKIKKSERKFRAVFNQAYQYIALLSLDGRILDVNETALSFTSLQKEELIGRFFWDAPWWENTPDLRREIRLDVQKAAKGEVVRFEGAHLAPDGTWSFEDSSLKPVTDDAGQVSMLISEGRDITKRKQIEDELKQYRRQLEGLVKARTAALEAKNKDLETFTYSVSHDLKAPLRGIDGYSRLLVEEYADKLDEEGLLFLRNIRHSTEQMHRLIEDLLTYSRMERRDLNPSTLDVRQLIDELIFERQHEISAASARITIDITDAQIVCDRQSIRQVLGNFIDNALKFTSTIADPAIVISLSENDDTWRFSVKDNGIGFDPKYRHRIFGIFQRLHRSEEFPGTGIGLALARKAALRMKGQAWAESGPGQGATFHLEIPKMQSNDA